MPHWKELSENVARKVCGTHPGMRRVCVSPQEVLDSGLTAPQLAKRWAEEQVLHMHTFEVLSHTPFEARNGEYASVYLMPRQREDPLGAITFSGEPSYHTEGLPADMEQRAKNLPPPLPDLEPEP